MQTQQTTRKAIPRLFCATDKRNKENKQLQIKNLKIVKENKDLFTLNHLKSKSNTLKYFCIFIHSFIKIVALEFF